MDMLGKSSTQAGGSAEIFCDTLPLKSNQHPITQSSQATDHPVSVKTKEILGVAREQLFPD